MALGGQAQAQKLERLKMPSRHVEAATKVTHFGATPALIRLIYICIYTYMHVCVCVCVRACVRARERESVCVCVYRAHGLGTGAADMLALIDYKH